MNIEDRLREALRREAAPADFKAKVMARARKPVWWRGAAAAVAIAAMLVMAVQIREHERAVVAKEQLVRALEITNVQLQQVREQIRKNVRGNK